MYIVCPFEEASLPADYYDLAFSAQSFHWIDPEIGYGKVHSSLKSGGYLALFSNFPSASTALEKAVRELQSRHCPDFPGVECGTLRMLSVPTDSILLIAKKEMKNRRELVKFYFSRRSQTFLMKLFQPETQVKLCLTSSFHLR